MEFNSLDFIFIFLPIFLFFFLLTRGVYRQWYIIISSAVYYYIFSKENLLFIIGLVLFNYAILIFLLRSEETPALRRSIFWSAIGINLIVLLFSKVITTGLWVDSPLLSRINHLPFVKSWVFPLGLSFITFQVLSCLIDSYRVKEKTPKTFRDYAAYLLFFPKIVVGPIARFSGFEKQFNDLTFSWVRFSSGSKRFIQGLFKKALIADQLAPIVNAGFSLDRPAYSTSIAWFVLIAFFIQIYYDFSGYIDMALGIAQIIGLDLPENFNAPYLSKSLSEFWRRWHMTLTAWFRDYVFYPLEYKRRKSKFLRVETDTLLVFFLTGLWHGLTPNYIVWGLLQGLVIVFENSRFGGWIKKLPALAQHLYLLTVVLASWVIFRAPSLDFAGRFFRRLVIVNQTVPAHPFSITQPLPIINHSAILIMLLGIIGLLPLSRIFELPRIKAARQSIAATALFNFGYLVLFVILVAVIVSQSFIPSIYGKF